MKDWIYHLKIVDIVEFAKMNRGDDEERYSDENIFLDVYEVEEEDINKMDELLNDYNLSFVHEDSR
jgi:hypothetical protein